MPCFYRLFGGLCLLIVTFLACNNPTDSDEPVNKLVTLNGQVINKETTSPMEGVVIRFLNFNTEMVSITDSAGSYYFNFETDNTFELKVWAFKESFIGDTVTVLATPGRIISMPLLILRPTSTTPVVSGGPATIVLNSVSQAAIGVKESGAPETAELIFEVQDSSGVPVDLSHVTNIRFSIGSGPGGGEFINPLSANTNNSGQVALNVFSGIKAGVVQIVAEFDAAGQTVYSRPVALAIHGGLPDLNYFSLTAQQQNFPGYNIYGLTDLITAFVGDEYANPVRPETAVYFTSSGGLIEGSANTNELGQASVNLISAAPQPLHPTLGPGFATVYARTANKNNETIETSMLVLFSGIPQVSVTPTSIAVPNGGAQDFDIKVQDQNGNPLSQGTNITVSVVYGSVNTFGDINVNLPDTQSKSWTDFSFSLVDAIPDSLNPNDVLVKVQTIGPNGQAQTSISGIAF